MYSASDLTTEIRQVIDEGLDAGRAQPVSWIVAAVRARHPFPASWDSDDRDFAELAVQAHLMVEVRKKLREYKVNAEPEDGEAARQARLPGFDHLQRGYLIQRNGEPSIVPLQQMTDFELTFVANRVERMAQGCLDHADELRRYRDQRTAAEGRAAEPAAAA